MKITEQRNGVLIAFGNKLNKKVKILFGFEAALFLAFSLALIIVLFNEIIGRDANLIVVFLTLAGITICSLSGWYYLKRVLKNESLFITKDALTISNSVINKKQEYIYPVAAITHLVYKGKAPKTDHPLKGKSFDYMGMETQELVIAEVHNEGNLSFFHNGKNIYFGREVYSWDAEKMNEIFTRVTDGQLHIENLEESTVEEHENYRGTQSDIQ